MLRHIALCLLLLPLYVMAAPVENYYDETGETWGFGFGSEEGGGGSSYLGVDIADVTAEQLSSLKLKEEHGAEITMVDSDAPAGKAGLKEHDVVLSLNGAAVESAAQLRRMIKETPAGRVVALGISRDGQPMEVKVQLADRRKAMKWTPEAHEYKFEMPEMPKIPEIDLPVSVVIAHSSLRSGLMVENITPQLGEFFGIKDGKGVLVRSVEKGSHGEKAGFHAGDVIVKVNGQAVRDASDFTHALRGTSNGAASVTVVRDKREQNLNLTLPSRKDSGLLLEDSFDIDIPELSEETQIAIRKSGEEIALLRPQLEKANREALRATEKVRRAWRERQKDFQKQIEDQQKQFQEQQQQFRDQQEKMRHSLLRNWADI